MDLTATQFGDRALTLTLPQFDVAAQRQLHWLAAQLAKEDGIAELVPGMGNLTLIGVDPLLDAARLEMLARERWAQRPESVATGALHTIDVIYDGPDLQSVADHCGLTIADVIARHSAVEYEVAFIGFMPGFPYLTGMDPALATPRLGRPRTRVPAGSVGIAGEQTGIYPQTSPGGWQLIGRTDSALFEVTREPPALLQPGDRLRFVPR